MFSIIIPVFNVEKYLPECLDSVLGQTFPDWEAICVNDGSTDGSVAILKEYSAKDDRFRIIEQPNGGLSAARNTGMKYASGNIVLFLDSDDWLESNALEVLSENWDGEDMVCFTGRRYLEAEDQYCPSDQLEERWYQTGMEYYNQNALQRRDFAFVCVVLRVYKRSFLVENNLLFKEGIYHEDNLFTPQACYYAQGVRVINDCLYDYRVRSNSISTTSSLKHLSDVMRVANELALFFTSKTGFDKTVVYRAITHHYQSVFDSIPKTERKAFRKVCNWSLYRKVSRTKPRHIVNYWLNRTIVL